jgi:hypothetical protein
MRTQEATEDIQGVGSSCAENDDYLSDDEMAIEEGSHVTRVLTLRVDAMPYCQS